MYATSDTPILVCNPGLSYACMLLYPYLSRCAPISVCEPACMYIMMQTRMPLCLYSDLGALVSVCEPWCSYVSMQALYLNASPDAPIPACKPVCSDTPIFEYKPVYFYACMRATVLLYPFVLLHLYACPDVHIPICKASCSYTRMQA